MKLLAFFMFVFGCTLIIVFIMSLIPRLDPVRRYKIEAELETEGWWVWVQDREWVNDADAKSSFLTLAIIKAMWKIRRQTHWTTLRRQHMPDVAPPERWPQDATPPSK